MALGSCSSSISKEIYALTSKSLERSSDTLGQPFNDCCLEKLFLRRLWAHNPWKVSRQGANGCPGPCLQSVPRASPSVVRTFCSPLRTNNMEVQALFLFFRPSLRLSDRLLSHKAKLRNYTVQSRLWDLSQKWCPTLYFCTNFIES